MWLDLIDLIIIVILVVHQDIWHLRYYVDKIIIMGLIILLLGLLPISLCLGGDPLEGGVGRKLGRKSLPDNLLLGNIKYLMIGH